MTTPARAVSPPSLGDLKAQRSPVRDINTEHEQSFSALERLAVVITDRVGTMGFFLIIFAWTVLWTGYNILASEVPATHLKAFDPFPAFVAYLLISNVIQILLMPLIMVGQNLQGRHSELRAENDFEVNVKAEREIEAILHHLEYQNAILITMLGKLGISTDEAVAALRERGITNPASSTTDTA